jgi:hypothetical protein
MTNAKHQLYPGAKALTAGRPAFTGGLVPRGAGLGNQYFDSQI